VTTVYMGGCAVVMALGARWIVPLFGADPSFQSVAVRLLHVAAVFQIFDGANVVARSTLRGAGDARYPAIIGVLTSWALTPPLTWLLGYRARLGAFGGWLGLSAEIIVGAAILWWRLERRSWAGVAAESRARLAAVRSAPIAARGGEDDDDGDGDGDSDVTLAPTGT
jgi:MATE family multidrug resistance protein